MLGFWICTSEADLCSGIVKCPQSLSKLLNMSVIVGDQGKLGMLMEGLEQELSRELTPWKELVWFQEEW